jgi:hypothetical protein
MKIRTQADVDALDKKIKTELGVDVSKYRDEEAIEAISGLLVFPLYVVSWTVRPVVLAFLLYICGFFLLDLIHIQYLLYGIVGLVLALVTGLFAGLLYLTLRFRSDLEGIMNYSMSIMRGIVEDMDQLNTTTHVGNRKEVLQLLFLGVMHIITIPAVSSIIGNRVPLIGGGIAHIVRRVLTTMTGLFKWDEKNLQAATLQAGDEGKILPAYLAGVRGFQNIMNKVLKVSIRVVQFPILLIFGFFALLTLVFVWAIN